MTTTFGVSVKVAAVSKKQARLIADAKCWPGLRRLGSTDADCRCVALGCEMPDVWYVTFEVHKRGTLQERRSPRATRTFATEGEARQFARTKFDEGLIVHAGTLNPHLPRRTILSGDVPGWLDDLREGEPADAHSSDRKEPG